MGPDSRHITLLGDSTLDNGAYTRGSPDVVTHLQRMLPAGWTATLGAVDGAVVADLPAQLRRVSDHTTDLVISIGGNDALRNSDLLALLVDSSAEALQVFAERIAGFESSYRTAIRQALELGRRIAICTVYNGALEPDRARIARPALAMFNDVILRTAIDLRLDALEMRSICTESADYANPIEPSGPGGLKIARAIAHLVGALPSEPPPARIWGLC